MLKRWLDEKEDEYEIQKSSIAYERDFYKMFINFMQKTKFDIVEEQIIVNPCKHEIEIRIRMGKLQRCFSNKYSLDIVKDYPDKVCIFVMESVKRYAETLCFNKEVEENV